MRIATPAEADALLDALPASEQATWATAFYAGLRRGELQALRCSAIDLGTSTIRVERSWDQYEGAIDPKSDTSTRTVPLLGELRDYLDEHLLTTGRSGEQLVFGRTAHDPFVPSTLRSRALRAWEPTELTPIGLHQCRHTFASMLIGARANPKAVQEAMGHSSIKVTFDLYGHLFPALVTSCGRWSTLTWSASWPRPVDQRWTNERSIQRPEATRGDHEDRMAKRYFA